MIRDLAESILASWEMSEEMQGEMHINEYRKRVLPYLDGKPFITVKQDTLENLIQLVDEIVKVKTKESHHKVDGEKEFKRFYTGLLGEAALEQFFGIPIINWSVGDSVQYKNSDLLKAGYDVGVKTSELWKFPLVAKDISRPQMIAVRVDERTIAIAGYAPVALLRARQIGKFVLHAGARQRKGGFYGFSDLDAVKNKACLDSLVPERYKVTG